VFLITVFTSFLGNRAEASQRIISAVQDYLPIDQAASTQVIQTIEGVVKMVPEVRKSRSTFMRNATNRSAVRTVK